MADQFTFGQPVLYAGKRYLYLGMEGPDAAIARVLDADGKWDIESVHPATLTAITPSSFDGWCRSGPRNQWASPCKAYEAGQKSMSVSAPIPVEGEHLIPSNSRELESPDPGEGFMAVLAKNARVGDEFWTGFRWDVITGHSINAIREFGTATVRRKLESPSNKEEGVPPGFFEELNPEYKMRVRDKVLGNTGKVTDIRDEGDLLVGSTVACMHETPKWRVFRPISKEDSQSVGDAEQSAAADAQECAVSDLGRDNADRWAAVIKAYIESTPSNVPAPPEGFEEEIDWEPLHVLDGWLFMSPREKAWFELGCPENEDDQKWIEGFWTSEGRMARPKVETPKTEAVQEEPIVIEHVIEREDDSPKAEVIATICSLAHVLYPNVGDRGQGHSNQGDGMTIPEKFQRLTVVDTEHFKPYNKSGLVEGPRGIVSASTRWSLAGWSLAGWMLEQMQERYHAIGESGKPPSRADCECLNVVNELDAPYLTPEYILNAYLAWREAKAEEGSK